MVAFALRDYQEECLEAILSEWERVDRTVAVLATGTGKSCIALALIDRILQSDSQARFLYWGHRRELITQPIERMEEFFPQLLPKTGIVMADQDDADSQIVIATVQTLSRASRLDACLEHGDFDYVISDEVHHDPSPTRMALIEKIGGKVVGFTATPIRTDGNGLRKIYQSCAYRFTIEVAIKRGALVPFDALGIGLPVSLAGIRRTEDGWESESLGDVLRAANVLEIVHEKWRELAEKRLTIGFTASVVQAYDTAAYFRERGVKAVAVSGETPKAERDQILRDFRSGKTRCAFNCDVWGEGADFPEVSCVMMIRPTHSDLQYVQRMGRGLRTAPDKLDCRVLDFAPMEERDIVFAGDILGVPRDVQAAEKKAERAGILGALSVNRQGLLTRVDPHELVVRVLEYLRRDKLAWAVEGCVATASLSKEHMLAVVLPDLDRVARGEELRRTLDADAWNVTHARLLRLLRSTRLYLIGRTGYGWRVEKATRHASFEDAHTMAAEYARELAEPALARRDRGWRRLDAKPSQVAYLARLGVEHGEGLDRGTASQMIARELATRAVARHARHEEMEAMHG